MFRGGQLGDCPHRRLAIVMGTPKPDIFADVRFSREGRPPCRPTYRSGPHNKEKNETARRPSLPGERIPPVGESPRTVLTGQARQGLSPRRYAGRAARRSAPTVGWP
jgi:hypothetical protein